MCLFQTAAHLSPGCLCERFGHPLQLLQHNLQIIPLILPLRSLRAVQVPRQREQKLKNGPHFLLHLGGTGQKVVVRVYPYSLTMGIARRKVPDIEPNNC